MTRMFSSARRAGTSHGRSVPVLRSVSTVSWSSIHHHHCAIAAISVLGWHWTKRRIVYTDNPTGYLPRVDICPDGSYCCDNDPTCCVDKQGFFLNSDGVVTARANQTTTTTTPSTTIATTSTTSSFASPSYTPEQAPSSAGLSQTAKIGLGVGCPAAALLFILLFFFIWRRRQRRQQCEGSDAAYQKSTPPTPYHEKPGSQLTSEASQPSELAVPPAELAARSLYFHDRVGLSELAATWGWKKRSATEERLRVVVCFV
jgi:hypothetical protein